MGSLLLQKTIPAELIVPWGGTSLPVIEQPVGSPKLMALALDDTVPQSVLIRCGRIFDELVSTARLVVSWWMHTGYTSGPYQFQAKVDARRAGDSGALNSFPETPVSGAVGAFPVTGGTLVFEEIEFPIGAQRDNVVYGDDLDVNLWLLQNGARAGVSQKLYIKWVEVRLEIPPLA